MANRSFLYVPGDRPDRVAKALASAADAVIVDLEDAVKPAGKHEARALVRELAPRSQGETWVRINSGDRGRLDLAAIAAIVAVDVVRSGHAADGRTDDRAIAGVVVAKCETTMWLDQVAASLRSGIAVAPLVETARAVRHLDELCAHPRVTQCHLGEVDLLADLGGRGSGADGLIHHARCELVIASAAAGILAPIGGVHLAIDDLDALGESSRLLAELGFSGRAVVHPSHCGLVNAAFGPSADEVAQALDVLARWEATTSGAVRAADGSMIDEAIVQRARRLLS